MTVKEKQDYERIFLEVWDNNLLEKGLLIEMCQLLELDKKKEDGDGFALFYYKTTNDRIFVIEDDEIHGTLEIYEEKK
jgi:hypothetical protein